MTYLICYAIIALQLSLPLLGAFGIINDWSCFPFSENWMLNATLVAPQLGIMFALVKISRPNPPMLMVPDDDFWHEIIQADHTIRDFAVQVKGGRKELKKMHKSAKQSDLLNLAVTTVEGVGLGALGVGMPDIVLFLGTLLKGVYETALNYGFDYESRQEQLFILKMMQTALSTGEDWVTRNAEVDGMLTLETIGITDDDFKRQMKDTASAFAVDMLLLKFIQGLPVVGILGGAANPVYYSKVMKYVQMKYRKRYLLKQKGATSNEISV